VGIAVRYRNFTLGLVLQVQVVWLSGAAVLGLIFSFAIVLPYPPVKKSFLADFFLGRLDNPQRWGGRIDAKMWLYLVGAVMLELNVLSFTSHHIILYGDQASPASIWLLPCFHSLLSITSFSKKFIFIPMIFSGKSWI